MIAEFIGGYLSNSVAIISDALHMGSDAIGYTVQLMSAVASQWPATPAYTFGFKRLEVVGGFFNCLIIWSLTAYLIYESIMRLIYPPLFFDHTIMLATAFMGVALNIIMGGILVGFSKIHRILNFWDKSTKTKNEDDEDYNLRITIAHIRGDMSYSVGVLLCAIVLFFYPKLLVLDSLCTVIFSFVVLKITHPIAASVTRFALEGVPESKLKRH